MVFTDIFGYIGGGILSINNIPQIYRIWRTRSADDLSYTTLILQIIGYIFYITYGIMISSFPIIVTLGVSFLFTLIVLAMKMWY